MGAWIYIQAGTNAIVGYYQIASVAANAATLSGGIGQALQIEAASGSYIPNTVAGCSTSTSLTSTTFGVDYSQQDTAQTTATDFASVGSSTTLTSATAAFNRVMVGNFFHQTTAGTGSFGITGWYEIVSYTNATTVVLDRTPNTGTASVSCTGFVGGAGRFNGLEDAFTEMLPAGSTTWFKTGTYVLSALISTASANGTAINPVSLTGYTALRGDVCIGNNMPLFSLGANGWTAGQNQIFMNMSITGTGTTLFTMAINGIALGCKFFNSSSVTTRSAQINSQGGTVINCEIISQNGFAAVNNTQGGKYFGNYIHDTETGISGNAASSIIVQNLLTTCSTAAISYSTSIRDIYNNTIYGTEAKVGIGMSFTGANSSLNKIISNIIYGCTTGISIATGTAGTNFGIGNDFFNNTTDAVNWFKSPSAIAINPQFAGASQITGTAATTTGSVLTDSAADFSSVTDNVDFVTVTAGTGTTLARYLIVSHTTTTLTVNNALGTGGTADKVYYITVGKNFMPTNTALIATGAPLFGTAISSNTSSFIVPGAVQRNSASGGGGASYTFVGQ